MSDLTIQNAGITVSAPRIELKAPQGPHGIDKGAAIRVKPTLYIAGETAVDKCSFNTTEISNAVLRNGGSSKLLGVTVVDYENQQKDFDLFFMQVQSNLGTFGTGAADISDANAKLAKYLGAYDVDWSQYKVGVGSLQSIHRLGYMSTGEDQNNIFPIMLQAETTSTSVYFTALQRAAVTWSAADSLEFIFHIEYL